MNGADSHGEERRLLSRNVCRCGGQRELAQIFKRPFVNLILVALLRDRLSRTRISLTIPQPSRQRLIFHEVLFLAQNSKLEARSIVSFATSSSFPPKKRRCWVPVPPKVETFETFDETMGRENHNPSGEVPQSPTKDVSSIMSANSTTLKSLDLAGSPERRKMRDIYNDTRKSLMEPIDPSSAGRRSLEPLGIDETTYNFVTNTTEGTDTPSELGTVTIQGGAKYEPEEILAEGE